MFDVRNIQPGLDVEEIETIEDWDIGFGEMIVFLGVILISFLGGAIVGDAANNHMLKRVGFEPKELLDAYNEVIKKKVK